MYTIVHPVHLSATISRTARVSSRNLGKSRASCTLPYLLARCLSKTSSERQPRTNAPDQYRNIDFAFAFNSTERMLDFGGLHHTRRFRNTLVHRADLYRAEPEAKIESSSVRHSFRSASVQPGSYLQLFRTLYPIRNVYEHMYIGIACKLCACWKVKAAIQRIPFLMRLNSLRDKTQVRRPKEDWNRQLS